MTFLSFRLMAHIYYSAGAPMPIPGFETRPLPGSLRARMHPKREGSGPMTTPTAPETVGTDPRKLDDFEQLCRGQIESGLHPGAGLAVYRYGKPVLDIHGGVADSSTGKTVGAGTMFVRFSFTKPLAQAFYRTFTKWIGAQVMIKVLLQ